jgi:hypothetical protein
MIEEMKLRNFSPRTEQSYVAAMVGLMSVGIIVGRRINSRKIRSLLSVASPRAGPLAEFAQRGDLGA